MRHESSLETTEISHDATEKNHLLSIIHTLVSHLGGQVAIPLDKFLSATKKYNQFPLTEETDVRTNTIYLRAEKPRFRRPPVVDRPELPGVQLPGSGVAAQAGLPEEPAAD